MESSSSSSSPSYSPSRRIPQKRKSARKKYFRKTRHPIYRGVRQRNANKWVSEVREPGKKSRIWLGTFPEPEMAARAHDVAALELRGRFASLNFPDLARFLPRARSSSVADIQLAAIQAAKAFQQPRKTPETSSVVDSPCLESQKNVPEASSEKAGDGFPTVLFVDEEAVFNMPSLIDGMAEGLLLTPPAMCRGFSWDDAVSHADLSLWNHDSQS